MDFMILDGIQKLHSPLLDTLFVCITRLGDKGFVWCLMALVFLLIPEKRKTGFVVCYQQTDFFHVHSQN